MIRLRPETEADEGFLFAVYASTREWEMAAIPFTPEQRQSFLEMQFRAQRLHYAKHYAEASFDIVLFEDEPAGRLCVLRTATDICVVDIAILSRFRGKGIGSVLLRQIFAEAASEGKTVSGHVECHNPALELWKRLGFEVVEDLGVFVKVLWRPPQMEGATPQMHR
jgi:ribosomal protein S18 acetylase RimI-like enzyme